MRNQESLLYIQKVLSEKVKDKAYNNVLISDNYEKPFIKYYYSESNEKVCHYQTDKCVSLYPGYTWLSNK